MGLKIDFPSKTGGTCTDAYVIADLTLDNKTKSGRLELAVWQSEEYRDANAQKINNISVRCGDAEVWHEDEKTEEKLYIQTLAFSDFMWQSGDYIYKKLKTLKVKVGEEIIDLSKSADVLAAS